MKTLPSETIAVETPCGTIHITYILNGEKGKELKIKNFDFRLSKEGVCARTHLVVLSQMTKLASDKGATITDIIEVLRGHSCSTADNRTSQKSCSHAVAYGLTQFLKKHKEIANESK